MSDCKSCCNTYAICAVHLMVDSGGGYSLSNFHNFVCQGPILWEQFTDLPGLAT